MAGLGRIYVRGEMKWNCVKGVRGTHIGVGYVLEMGILEWAMCTVSCVGAGCVCVCMYFHIYLHI